MGATSVERISDMGEYSFPAYMLPKGLSPRKLIEKRILMQENRQNWVHGLKGKSYETHYAVARAAVRSNFQQFTVPYEEELMKFYAL